MKTVIDRKVNNNERTVILAYIAVSLIWGSTYLAIRIGVNEFPPETFTGIRFIISAIILFILARFKGEVFPDNFKAIGRTSIVGLLFQGSIGLVAWGEQFVNSGVTSLLVAIGPIFMALIELVLPHGHKNGVRAWIGLFIGFSGVALLVLSGSETGAIDLKGSLLLIIAALIWSIGSIYSQRINTSGSMFTHLSIQMFVGGLFLFIVGIIMGESLKVHLTLRGVGAIAYLILVGTLIGYSSYIYVLQNWSTTKAGTSAYINPVVAVFLGALVLGEPITMKLILSAIIILSGVLLVQFADAKSLKTLYKSLAG